MNTILKNIFLFDGCDFEAFDNKYNISASCTRHSLQNGDVLNYIEDLQGLPIVIKGAVTVLTKSDKLIRYAGVGEILGVAMLFTSETKDITKIKAACDCEILLFPTALINILLKNEFKVAQNYLRFLSDKVHFLNRKINILTQGSAEQRLAVFLCGLGDEFTLPVSYIELAKYLSLGRASLYRALDFFEDERIIARDGKSIKILDRNKLINTYGGNNL